MPEKHVYEAPPKYTERVAKDKVTEEDILAEANRRTGDSAIYLFYIRSVGWIPTIIFMVSITIFIFGQLFPSKSPLFPLQHAHILINVFQPGGSKNGLHLIKRIPTRSLGFTLVFTACLEAFRSCSCSLVAGE